MKNLIVIILAAVLSLSVFTACSDDDSSLKKDKENSSVSQSSESSSEESSGEKSGEISEMLADTYTKSAFNAANAYCSEKDAAGEPVTFVLWEFDPTRPDKDEEFEVYITGALDENYEGYLSFEFEKGEVKCVKFNNKSGDTIGQYPKE